ncbi:FAD-dependent oxidoreductase [Microbacterium esteraromaticum]|uniref:FAD-dependent oxidoreductase n=1 Tax=Microbacterium esteraromaticum TaxID=57043 RepID=UPI002175091B|nr:FAD-dependent oxidoreductase [Microbacterium esteraromaticum]
MGELWLENQFRNPEGNPYYWDLVVLEAVRAEENITLFLNTDVHEVEASGSPEQRRIDSVTGWQMGSERRIRFRSPAYVDCSGDALVGHLAGAEYMIGRESREDFGESWAPDATDSELLGSTILFYSKDAGHPSEFVPPSFAVDISQTDIPSRRVIRSDMRGCAFWWIEWGGERDVTDENELIRDELQGICYGIWDHIKNSGEFEGVENLTLEWIGAVPGKREYRRLIGDHVLTQEDILSQRDFPDAVTFGGWSIDLHPAGGVYSSAPASRHWFSDGNYDIPLRSLYSRNVGNLWMAGRNISATHVAFGSTRVMATCAALGEAVGLAAAIGTREGLTPRELAGVEFWRMRAAMTRADSSALGLRHLDPSDHALDARVSASSTRAVLETTPGGEALALASDLAVVVPVSGDVLQLEIRVGAIEDSVLALDVHGVSKARNYLPDRVLAKTTIDVAASDPAWLRVDVPLPARPAEDGENVVVVLRADDRVFVESSDADAPGLSFMRRRPLESHEAWPLQFRHWKRFATGQGFAVRVRGVTGTFAPARVLGGYSRPYGGPQMWSSERLAVDANPTLDLSWDAPVSVHEVQVLLDADLMIDLVNLHHHWTPDRIMPTLLRDFDVLVRIGGRWSTLQKVRENRHRRVRIPLALPIAIDGLRIVAHATNGADHAHVVGVRAFGTPAAPSSQ